MLDRMLRCPFTVSQTASAPTMLDSLTLGTPFMPERMVV